MSEAKFVSAFDSIADAVQKAAQLPDHRERPMDPLTVTVDSPNQEVTVTVEDAKVTSLVFDRHWFGEVRPDVAADVMKKVVNDAFFEWNKQHLDQIMNVTPDMKELAVSIQAAREKLDDAWVATLAEAKVPPA